MRPIVLFALSLCMVACRVERKQPVDIDLDGVPSDVDCDDRDPDVGSQATLYKDADGDGYGAGSPAADCREEGLVTSGNDCDDQDANVHPGATEFCDGRDDNCDGAVDNNAEDAADWYRDSDEDGFGGPEVQTACRAPSSAYADIGGDCDDNDPAAHPGAVEVWYDGIDQDCSGGSDFDQDLDGHDCDGSVVTDCVGHAGDDCVDDPAGVGGVFGSRIHPGAVETWYDGVDQDCAVDNDFDQDGDGYECDGLVVGTCAGHVGDDCVDDPGGQAGIPGSAINIAAYDTWYDGVDQDCAGDDDFDQDLDGSPLPLDCDDLDPVAVPGGVSHVPSDYSTIQEALDAACEDMRVEVAAGQYQEHLVFPSTTVQLVGTAGLANTTIDGGLVGRCIEITEPGASPTIEGFTIANGYALKGGGLFVDSASPTLKSVLVENTQAADGAAIFVARSEGDVELNLEQVTVTGSLADSGSGVFVDDGAYQAGLNFGQVVFTDNTNLLVEAHDVMIAWTSVTVLRTASSNRTMFLQRASGSVSGLYAEDNDDGVLTLWDSNVALEDITLRNNGRLGAETPLTIDDGVVSINGLDASGNAGSRGGTLGASSADVLVRDARIVGGRANAGGGIYASLGTLEVLNTELLDNFSAYDGGGLWSKTTTVTLDGLVLAGNRADNGAGGYFENERVDMSNVTVVGNTALDNGGGMFFSQLDVVASNVALTNNTATAGGGLWRDFAPLAVTYTDAVDNSPDNYGNFPDPTGTSGNVTVLPLYVSFSPAMPVETWDLHLRPASPLLDAGAPTVFDPDGSRSDVGAYGGPNADFSYYDDVDSDGLYDGWEAGFGLTIGVDDAGADSDGDGRSNLDEFSVGTSPVASDTDGDGVDDGAEATAGTDPLDPFDF